jgi:hypothetical protein
VSSHSCTLSIMVARSDVPFLPYTIPHLVRMCKYPFKRKSLIRDTAPLADEFAQRSNVGTLSQLISCCDQLLTSGLIDEVIDIDYSEECRSRIYEKHFDADLKDTHGSLGTSIFGYIYSLAMAHTDYLVHFDCDMLIHQSPDICWIEQGIAVLQERPDVIVINPRPGPPSSDGVLHQLEPYNLDTEGFYSFKCFSSRLYLIDINRFNQLLPLHPEVMSNGKLALWERMVTQRMMEKSFIRADLTAANAWSLHPTDHGLNFVTALPRIIEKIEEGWYPKEQAGYYDLRLGMWMRDLGIEQLGARARNVKQALEICILELVSKPRPSIGLSNVSFRFLISGDGGGSWVVDLSNLKNPIHMSEGPAHCTINISANNLIDIVNGELNPVLAMKLGWLQVTGDTKLFRSVISLLSPRWAGLLCDSF